MTDEMKKDGVEIPIEDGNVVAENEEMAEHNAEVGAEAEVGVDAEAVDAGEDVGVEDVADAEADSAAETATDAADASTDAADASTDASTETATTGDDMQAKYVRLMAEFQNYKKRTAKEKEDIYAFGAEKVMLSLMEVLDNFDRALEQGCSDEKHAEGIRLVHTQLMNALKKNGLEEIEALGEDFDPNFHSAVVMEDTDEYESGKVCFVVQKGYKLNGKVIRPAMVKVAN
ncbi:MAG: nucleotide exchange factor GrpE [Firmicutes bacterium]|nr:nucleotide exchange factor GrpE [Bacillota bacterium]